MDHDKKQPEQTKDAHNGYGHHNMLRVNYQRMSDTAFFDPNAAKKDKKLQNK